MKGDKPKWKWRLNSDGRWLRHSWQLNDWLTSWIACLHPDVLDGVCVYLFVCECSYSWLVVDESGIQTSSTELRHAYLSCTNLNQMKMARNIIECTWKGFHSGHTHKSIKLSYIFATTPYFSFTKKFAMIGEVHQFFFVSRSFTLFFRLFLYLVFNMMPHWSFWLVNFTLFLTKRCVIPFHSHLCDWLLTVRYRNNIDAHLQFAYQSRNKGKTILVFAIHST